MSVFRRLSLEERPPWSDVTSAGFTRVVAGGTFDPHYHDCDEYWFIISGHAIARIEDERYELGPGDILCTEIGHLHDVMAVDDVLEMVWFEAHLTPGGREGHLHRNEVDAAGHPVDVLHLAPDLHSGIRVEVVRTRRSGWSWGRPVGPSGPTALRPPSGQERVG